EVTDHIALYHEGSQRIDDIFAKYGEEIAADTLADSVAKGSAGFTKEWDINGETVTLGVEKK
ncbi:MAG: hypothetical protein IJN08_03130, partial [Clostridia bacterium]|nr:hypothetical protein [Clostridia bacterium]